MESPFEYKWIYFVKTKQLLKTSIWEVRAKKDNGLLGEVGWYSKWRQYVFAPCPQTIYEDDCLRDIRDFLLRLEAKRKGAKNE